MDDFFEPQEAAPDLRLQQGGWQWEQTLITLLAGAAAAFGMAFLTRNIDVRPPWLIGLCCAAPVLAAYLAAILVETGTSAMTPQYTHGVQFLVTLAAVVLTFVVSWAGCMIYQGTYVPRDENRQIIIPQAEPGYADIMLVVDKSSSMTAEYGGKSRDQYSREAIENLLAELPDDARVGIIAFDHEIYETVSIAELDTAQRRRILGVAGLEPRGATDFFVALDKALELAGNDTGHKADYPLRIVLMTDADDEFETLTGKTDDLAGRCNELNATVSVIQQQVTSFGENNLYDLAEKTNGAGLNLTDLSGLTDALNNAAVVQVTPKLSEDEIRRLMVENDLLRSTHTPAKVTTAILLFVESLLFGIGLTMMLSVGGQRRFQPILSLLMGAAAYAVIKHIGPMLDPGPERWWIVEGTGLSLLSLVIMRRNSAKRIASAYREAPAETGSADDFF